MSKSLPQLIQSYQKFRKKYVTHDCTVMKHLAHQGQHPEVMIVSCCDSRVDPAIILQCDPGDLFIVRNVANIIAPYRQDNSTGAALEFGICHLQVKHLIILGHSQCGGVAALNQKNSKPDDFITRWMSLIANAATAEDNEALAKQALRCSYENCLTFPWIQQRLITKDLTIHLWFFDIQQGAISNYVFAQQQYELLGK